MRPLQEILGHASTVADGDMSPKLLCPWCGGGSGGELSLTVGRSGGRVWWNCWRASCTKPKGTVADNSLVTTTGRARQKSALEYEAQNVPKDLIGTMHAKIKSPSLRELVKFTPQYGGRFILPVVDRYGRTRGAVLRTYDSKQKRKTLSDYSNYSGCSWASDHVDMRHVVVVEDIVSEWRLYDFSGITGCALLGTSLSEDRMVDLLSCAPDKITVCLDADATLVAVNLCDAINMRAGKAIAKVVALTKDIKDMNDEELTELLVHIGDAHA